MPKFKSVQFTTEAGQIGHWIQITEGDFSGVRYSYGPVRFAGEDEKGNGKFDFAYILDPKTPVKEDNLPLLEYQMGEILNQILLQMIERDDTLRESEVEDINDVDV